MILFKKRITKALIRLRGCAGWSAPVLFANIPNTCFLVSRPICIQRHNILMDKHNVHLLQVYGGVFEDKQIILQET